MFTANTVPDDLTRTVARALEEDVGSGDITARLIPAETQASARLTVREKALICGIPWADEVLRQIDQAASASWHVKDGQLVEADTLLADLTGSARSLLTAERTMLNFLQTLSGTATQAHRLAGLVRHTKVTLLDTRKTIPGLRSAQKYAVALGGCRNHRMGLYDAFLIKENHILACGSIMAAVHSARKLGPGNPVEVEIERLEQLNEAIDAGADIVMLDNFNLDTMAQAVKLGGGRVKLEASGGIEESKLIAIAESGVDYISIGALTKHCRAIDLSLRFC